jgi:hypothetical protein
MGATLRKAAKCIKSRLATADDEDDDEDAL